MKKIAIIGISGSGKSTLAYKLGDILGIPVIHLDKEYWSHDWKKKFTEVEWTKHQQSLVQGDKWIIEGNYREDIEIRLAAADTIIYFDIPKWLALFRVLKRRLTTKKSFDKEENAKERINFTIIRYILNYPKSAVTKTLKKYSHKQVFTIHNSRETTKLLNSLK